MRKRAVSIVVLAWLACHAPAQYVATILSAPGFLGSRALAIANGKAVGYGYLDTSQQDVKALTWDLSTGQVIDITPMDWYGVATATDGPSHVGWVFGPGSVDHHAQFWRADGKTAELHPTGATISEAYGVAGGAQVGKFYTAAGGFQDRPCLWRGSADSFVDLTPTGFSGGLALCTTGASLGGNAGGLAGIWTGTADSFAILHPNGYYSSLIEGMTESEQVGNAMPNNLLFHAGLWHGSADTFVDLHPQGAFRSEAFGTNGRVQVGQVRTTTAEFGHAVAWFGTAQSAINLQTFLTGSYDMTVASGVDLAGSIVGTAWRDNASTSAILWVPVPEPGGVETLAIALVALAFQRLRGGCLS